MVFYGMWWLLGGSLKLSQKPISHDVVVVGCQSAVGNTAQEGITYHLPRSD